MRPLELPPKLERSVLHSIAHGLIAPDTFPEAAMSPLGQCVLKSMRTLLKHGAIAPLALSEISAIAGEQYGAPSAPLREYLSKLARAGKRADVAIAAHSLLDRRLVMAVAEKIGEQLISGEIDIDAIAGMLASQRTTKAMESAAALLEVLPPDTAGPEIPSLPKLSAANRGIQGRIVIGGLPNIGKTPLAWQIAVAYADEGKRPVLWYALDMSPRKILERHREIGFKDAKRKIRSVYFREHVGTLDSDLHQLATPTLVVVDSLQALPINAKGDRRLSLDNWLNRFKGYEGSGHAFILTSEIARSAYKEVRLSAFKETGAIEYVGTYCLELVPADEDAENHATAEVHIVKDRERPEFKGRHLVDLAPRKRPWLAKEVEPEQLEEEIDD